MKLSLSILVVIGLGAAIYKIYGKSGLWSALLLAGMLLTKDAVLHLWGPPAEYACVTLFVVAAVIIYMIRRRRGRLAKHQHKHGKKGSAAGHP